MLYISTNVSIPENEIELTAIRAQGAGGQNVNKVSSAIHLRFNIHRSSLADFYKDRLLTLKDSRISSDGTIIIKAQRFRSQEKNRDDALDRLGEIIRGVITLRKVRKKRKPSMAAKKRRLNDKKFRSNLKNLRQNRFD